MDEQIEKTLLEIAQANQVKDELFMKLRELV